MPTTHLASFHPTIRLRTCSQHLFLQLFSLRLSLLLLSLTKSGCTLRSSLRSTLRSTFPRRSIFSGLTLLPDAFGNKLNTA
mmetsp:Transcript_28136/g.61613  ORF Transcript_28136/g.61613 Transcript_28136/m.61613 type:complete len:81 (-) Transcript_28136:2649-2891(-)